MRRVRELLGISAVSLLRYGVHPDDDVNSAVKILEVRAPHLASLLKALAESEAPSWS